MTARPRGQDVYALPIRRRSAEWALRELTPPTGPPIAGAHVMSALLRAGLQVDSGPPGAPPGPHDRLDLVLGSSKTAHNDLISGPFPAPPHTAVRSAEFR